MATAFHIDYNDYSVSRVTGVTNTQVNISKVAPANINDTDAVKTGKVFESSVSADVKSFLTDILTAMSDAKTANGWAYSNPRAIGSDYLGEVAAFYHSGNGTTHVVIKQILKAYAASPRLHPYQFEMNIDGYYNEAGTAAKTFYDDLTTAKNTI